MYSPERLKKIYRIGKSCHGEIKPMISEMETLELPFLYWSEFFWTIKNLYHIVPSRDPLASEGSWGMTHQRTEMDAPRPDAAPVTTATLFANLCILKSLPQFFSYKYCLKTMQIMSHFLKKIVYECIIWYYWKYWSQ